MNFKLSYILNICALDKLMYENNVTNIINSKKNSENNSHIYELIYSIILISGLIGVSIAFIRKVYMSSTKIELNSIIKKIYPDLNALVSLNVFRFFDQFQLHLNECLQI